MRYARITKEVLVRHPENPILTAKDFPVRMRAVYNSAGVKVGKNKYVMLCRSNQLNYKTLLWGADSKDGVHFKMRPEPYEVPETPEWERYASTVYYDPRVTYIEGRYLVLLACMNTTYTRVAMFESTDNLQTVKFINYVNAPDNRNMVIFPERAKDGRYMRLERPNISGGSNQEIWLSFSPDLIHWGDSREALRSTDAWNYALAGIGPSTVPVRTEDGWLILFHGIMNNCTVKEYSVGAALLDLDEPWKVKHVTQYPVLQPTAPYEMSGLITVVCFPCSMIVEPDNSVKVYYGAADTVQCLATGQLEDLIYACKNW
jgi:predicted GH43/DUF377 family glycosyl hydrolase